MEFLHQIHNVDLHRQHVSLTVDYKYKYALCGADPARVVVPYIFLNNDIL